MNPGQYAAVFLQNQVIVDAFRWRATDRRLSEQNLSTSGDFLLRQTSKDLAIDFGRPQNVLHKSIDKNVGNRG